MPESLELFDEVSPPGLHRDHCGCQEIAHVADALRVIQGFLSKLSEQFPSLSKTFLLEEAPDLAECVTLSHGQEYDRWLARIASNMLLK